MASNTKPVRVPVILQMEALECGAASLSMILAYYKKWVPLEQVRIACGVSRDGSNVLSIAKAAKGYGLKYKALMIKADKLQEKATFPCIIFWNRCHFVVLDGFKNGYAYLNDPAMGRVRLPMEDFKRSYSNVCLCLEKDEGFEPGGKPASTFAFLKERIHGNGATLFLIMITSALSMIAGTLIPVISRVFTDNILSRKTPSWYQGLLWIFLAVILFQLTAGIINLIYTRRATGKLAVTANAAFMKHVFRMPMAFFSQRSAGDLANRATSNDSVASALVGQMAPVIVDTDRNRYRHHQSVPCPPDLQQKNGDLQDPDARSGHAGGSHRIRYQYGGNHQGIRCGKRIPGNVVRLSCCSSQVKS